MYKHVLTIALLIMAGFFYWVRTHASVSTASSARTVLMVLVVGSIISAITNHTAKE